MAEVIISDNYPQESILSLWAEVFGKEEAEMEKVQIDGSEAIYNKDIVFSAVENDKLLATIHITLPKKCGEIAALSGFCTAPAASGRGIPYIDLWERCCLNPALQWMYNPKKRRP